MIVILSYIFYSFLSTSHLVFSLSTEAYPVKATFTVFIYYATAAAFAAVAQVACACRPDRFWEVFGFLLVTLLVAILVNTLPDQPLDFYFKDNDIMREKLGSIRDIEKWREFHLAFEKYFFNIVVLWFLFRLDENEFEADKDLRLPRDPMVPWASLLYLIYFIDFFLTFFNDKDAALAAKVGAILYIILSYIWGALRRALIQRKISSEILDDCFVFLSFCFYFFIFDAPLFFALLFSGNWPY